MEWTSRTINTAETTAECYTPRIREDNLNTYGNPPMTENTSLSSNPVLQELGEMLNLAEESTANIDRFADHLDRVQLQMWGYAAGAYIVLGLSLGTLAWVTDSYRQITTVIFITTVITAIVGIAASIGLGFVARARFLRLKSMRRDERAERDIQEKLISLIDEQTRRVKHDWTLSTISVATLEIRLRRLDRSDQKRKY